MDYKLFTHIVAVGACYIDTILTVSAYPPEDAKQRASSISKRRGGNCPNTLEVIQQLFYPSFSSSELAGNEGEASKPQFALTQTPKLVLLSTLPCQTSSDTKFISDSFNLQTTANKSTSTPSRDDNGNGSKSSIDLSHTFYRTTNTTAASSYIIQSQTTNSRTIVNYNDLEEMTTSEFQDAVTSLLNSPSTNTSKPTSTSTSEPEAETQKTVWFHFEGRIPETTLQCITWLRETFSSSTSTSTSSTNIQRKSNIHVTISVECEKPSRPGLEELAEQADVVFYSRSWAEGKGYRSADECCVAEAKRMNATSQNQPSLSQVERRRVVLCCTWGELGASMHEIDTNININISMGQTKRHEHNDSGKGNTSISPHGSASRPSWSPPDGDLKVVDTIGAGDTWIAGMLFALTSKQFWGLERKIEFANELAGRKIMRVGFGGLGTDMKGWIAEE